MSSAKTSFKQYKFRTWTCICQSELYEVSENFFSQISRWPASEVRLFVLLLLELQERAHDIEKQHGHGGEDDHPYIPVGDVGIEHPSRHDRVDEPDDSDKKRRKAYP